MRSNCGLQRGLPAFAHAGDEQAFRFGLCNDETKGRETAGPPFPRPESMLCIRLETNGQVSGIQQRRAGKTGRLERLGSDWA